MRVISIFNNVALTSLDTATSETINMLVPRHAVTEPVGNDGFASIQFAVTGAVTFYFDMSHDGSTWVEIASVAGSASGLEPVEIVFAPFLRVRAKETGASTATVTASVCV